MTDKPACFGQQYASAFREASVADAYAYRPTYPPAAFKVLAGLLPSKAQRLLDAGCGTGVLARNLTFLDIPIDAVDISPAMVERGQRLPNGDHPLIHWSVGAIETISLTPPYALITAGESLHWTDWHTVLPRFAKLLVPGGRLVLLDIGHQPLPWGDQLGQVIRQYSTNRDYQALDLIDELRRRDLFVEEGHTETAPWPFRQSIEDYIESFHGRASFSRERMLPAQAAAFDSAVRAMVMSYSHTSVELRIVASIVWGSPLFGALKYHSIR
jgi:SAM-dependent methyltransferase